MSGRSFLFVPADRPDMLAKARHRGADAVIVDLEDAVAPARRENALDDVAGWLAEQRGDEGSEVWVRVSSSADAQRQRKKLTVGPLAGIVVPKVRSASELGPIAALEVPIIAFVETASAVLEAATIAALPPVTRLVLGEADLGADLGIAPTGTEELFLPIRTQIVVASAAAGIDPPLGPVDPDFSDLERYRASTTLLRRLGFAGRCCIHPAQVAVVNEVFTPSSEEVEHARGLVAAYERAVAAGDGVIVGEDGTMVDEAYVRSARRILAQVDEPRTEQTVRPSTSEQRAR